jgi:TetR/AcrR family acrAB operon transcriptional repressor
MRRTKEEAARTRKAIIDSAEKLFIEKGYEATSLQDIASSAGLTRGAVHWHFQNKQGILTAIRERIELPLEKLAELLAKNELSDPLGALADTISYILHEFQSDTRLKKLTKLLLKYELSRTDEQVSGLSMEQKARLIVTEVLTRANREGSLPENWKPETGALAFVGLVSGLITEWVREDTDFKLVPDAENVVRAFLAAWGAKLPTITESELAGQL